jgi:bifunctional non-homologous end joining protein LigD
VVVFHEDWTNFSELQADLAAGRQDRLIYYAFDLLWHNGDVRKLPQIKRKQALLDFLGANGVEMPVLYSEHLIGDGQEMFEHAAKLNWEGIVSKRANASYRSERTEAWLKIKTVQKGKFPVIGFIKDPTGRRRALPREAGRE